MALLMDNGRQIAAKKSILCVMIIIASHSGCGGKVSVGTDAERPHAPRITGVDAAPGRALVDYKLTGVVRQVEAQSAHVTIDHEEIPGFMGAMTMRFPCKDRAALAQLAPGDHVEGTLRVVRTDGTVSNYELVGLVKTEAQPPRLVLEISKEEARIREQPRRLALGDRVPDFAMTGQDGIRVRLSDLRGYVVVLTFIYTRCPLPDFCPLMDRKFSSLAQRVSSSPGRAKDIRMISLSFDPDHDTPDVLRKHAEMRGALPPLWSYAVASQEELAKIAGPLGLVYGTGKDEIAHNLCTAVIDREGRLARLEVGRASNQWETIELLKTMYSLIPPS
jgi:protein SCO1/2